MSYPKGVMALDIPTPEPADEFVAKASAVAKENLGFVPNILKGYAHVPERLKNFFATRDELMTSDSGLSPLEREMIAVVVSAHNRCFYCLTSHGSKVRQLSGDPTLSERLIMNYRHAGLDDRVRAMLDFAITLTEAPQYIGDDDRDMLREQGFSEEDIWDIIEVTAFFNMTNRLAAGTEMIPNEEYHSLAR